MRDGKIALPTMCPQSAPPSLAAGGSIAQVREMAERVGFEPTEGLHLHLISSQARSTGLRHLSARPERLANAPSTAGSPHAPTGL